MEDDRKITRVELGVFQTFIKNKNTAWAYILILIIYSFLTLSLSTTPLLLTF